MSVLLLNLDISITVIQFLSPKSLECWLPTALVGKARQLVAGVGSHLQRNAISAAAGQDMTRHQYDKENHNTPPSFGRIKGILAEGGPQPVLVQNSGRQVTLGSWRFRGAGVLGVAWLRPTHSLSPSIASAAPRLECPTNAPTPRQPHNQSRPPLQRCRSNKWIQ